MRGWLKLLPWFVVVPIARRCCEVIDVGGRQYVQPFNGGPLVSRSNA